MGSEENAQSCADCVGGRDMAKEVKRWKIKLGRALGEAPSMSVR